MEIKVLSNTSNRMYQDCFNNVYTVCQFSFKHSVYLVNKLEPACYEVHLKLTFVAE